MNSAEFFMRYCGDKLLPTDKRSGNDVKDAATVLEIAHPLQDGKTLRLSSCWMVITPNGVTTSFKAHLSTGFDTSGQSNKDKDGKIIPGQKKTERKDAIVAALKQGDCMLLALSKRSMTPQDLFITYDPRAARLCSPGEVITFDATKEKTWTP
jgi:hypothetical protein